MKAGCDQPATPGDATTGEHCGSDQGWKCEASQERDTFGITGDEGLNFLRQQRHPEQAFGLDVCWFINTVSRFAKRANAIELPEIGRMSTGPNLPAGQGYRRRN
jgi:hypothetical protein